MILMSIIAAVSKLEQLHSLLNGTTLADIETEVVDSKKLLADVMVLLGYGAPAVAAAPDEAA